MPYKPWADHADGLRFLSSPVFYRVLAIGIVINILVICVAVATTYWLLPNYLFLCPFLGWPVSHLTYRISKAISWKMYLEQKEQDEHRALAS